MKSAIARTADSFRNPSSEYRGKPFWAWNGRLDEDELRRQIRIFGRMGLGGAFMHSRVGLDTPYLSREWFDIVDACAAEASSKGLETWLYDEDRWPSGAAGGIVTKNKKFRARKIVLKILGFGDGRSPASGKDEIAFSVKMNDGKIQTYHRLPLGRRISKGCCLMLFTVESDPESSWYNDQTYLDTLSRDAVHKFIRVTHKAYARNNGKHFGSTIPGIFTDEPNYGGFRFKAGEGGSAPWTDELPKTFRKRYGYDLRDHLPEIFFGTVRNAFSKIRRDYRDCLSFLFCRSFAKQIYDWCEKKGIMSTGHVLAEETLASQTGVVGSAMRYYEFMQVPGIDILRAQILTREGNWPPEYLTAKQCSSVQNQFGRKWMLSELYGCTGWDFTLAEHKAVGDWQAALGVNLRCQHLSYYTMKGEAKRDYPASISYQSPWWKDYGIVEDYFARVNFLMTQGRAVRDIAVVHPIESAWGLFRGDSGEETKPLDEDLASLQYDLLRNHYDFDYVDEDILSRHGRAENSGLLKVATARYRAVIVPSMITIRSSTLKILSEFRRKGGTVIFAGKIPGFLDSLKSAEPAKFAKQHAARADASLLPGLLSKIKGLEHISVKTADGSEYHPCLYMLRKDSRKGRYFLFITHSLQNESSGELVIELPAAGQAQEWDAKTGGIYMADYKIVKGRTRIRTVLHGCGSRLFVIDPNPAAAYEPQARLEETGRIALNPEKWEILRDEPNAFVLDMPKYSLGKGKWEDELEVLKLDDMIRTRLGVRHRGGAMVQPWARKKSSLKNSIPLNMRYSFFVENIPSGPCHLVLEDPEKFALSLNGSILETDCDEGWWIDKSFRKIKVPPSFFRQGMNELAASVNYDEDCGLEAMYLTGEFGFRRDGRKAVVTALPDRLAIGDWRSQGFASYSGSITYRTTVQIKNRKGEKAFLEIPSWCGTVLKVRVNGKNAGGVAWPPYELEIGEMLKAGENRIDIEIVSSRRNILGPLHLAVVSPWIGPGQFKTTDEHWTDDYVTVPYGLLAEPVISFRKYSFSEK